MFESTPQYPLKHAHHRRHLAILVLALIVFLLIMGGYVYRSDYSGSADNGQIPSPSSSWSAADQRAKQAVLDTISVRVTDTLSPSELKTKQALLKSIRR